MHPRGGGAFCGTDKRKKRVVKVNKLTFDNTAISKNRTRSKESKLREKGYGVVELRFSQRKG